MRQRRASATLIGLVLGLGVAGCAASSNAATRNAGRPGPPRPGPPTLRQRLLPSNALPGFHRIAQPMVIRSALDWAVTSGLPGGTGQADAVRLERLGFEAAARELLAGGRRVTAEVQSIVEQFAAASGAGHELAYRYRQARSTPGSRATPFPVTGVSGGLGVLTASPSLTTQTVMFTRGACFYLVRSFVTGGAAGAPSRSALVAAIRTWPSGAC